MAINLAAILANPLSILHLNEAPRFKQFNSLVSCHHILQYFTKYIQLLLAKMVTVETFCQKLYLLVSLIFQWNNLYFHCIFPLNKFFFHRKRVGTIALSHDGIKNPKLHCIMSEDQGTSRLKASAGDITISWGNAQMSQMALACWNCWRNACQCTFMLWYADRLVWQNTPVHKNVKAKFQKGKNVFSKYQKSKKEGNLEVSWPEIGFVAADLLVYYLLVYFDCTRKKGENG